MVHWHSHNHSSVHSDMLRLRHKYSHLVASKTHRRWRHGWFNGGLRCWTGLRGFSREGPVEYVHDYSRYGPPDALRTGRRWPLGRALAEWGKCVTLVLSQVTVITCLLKIYCARQCAPHCVGTIKDTVPFRIPPGTTCHTCGVAMLLWSCRLLNKNRVYVNTSVLLCQQGR